MLSGFDGRAGEDNALDLATVQRLHRGRHRQVTLARSRRSDAEGDDRVIDGVGIALLSGGRGPDHLALGAAHDFVPQDFAGSKVVRDHVDGARDLRRVEGLTAFEHQDQFVEEPQHLGGVGPGHRNLVALDSDLGMGKRPFNHPQMFVARAQQA